MKKLKGPDLKMPDLKVPGLVSDLYYDLRDRRLLPLVGLVLVAIVAVPFFLSGGSEEQGPPRIVPPEPSSANASQLTVVAATPGLRAYKQRLRNRSPKDPFKKPPVSTVSGGELGTESDNGFEPGEISSSTSSTSSTKTDTTETTKTTKSKNGVVTTETTTKSTDEGSKDGSKDAPETALATFAIDVKIKQKTTAADGTGVTKTFQRANLLVPASLPGKKTQVVTYMGISPETRNPMFLISEDVTSVFGEGKCLAGTETCQLLEVETGMPTTFVFGPAADSYKITVVKVHSVTAHES
jgi:hypothetical protein